MIIGRPLTLLALSLSAALGAVCFATPAAAQTEMPLWMGPTTQNASLTILKPVRSWKDMKFTGLVRQRTDFSCGAAVIATIFNAAYGRKTTEQQVLVNMLKLADPDVVKDKGFSLLDMKNYVKAVGMSGEGFEVPFDALAQLKVPGIALINIRGYKHFVVIRKAEKDFVQIGDPAIGNRVMSRREFQAAWNGVVFVILGEGYDAQTALRNPPPPLSARRLFDQRSPIQDVDATNFGVTSPTSFSF